MAITIFIVGCGFLGEATADLLFQKGYIVCGMCATQGAAQRLQHKPYSVTGCDVSQWEPLQKFSETPPDKILFCASSRGGGEEEYQNLYLQGVRNLQKTWSSAQLLFTSSTSVYAQTRGEIVDENSPTEPAGTRGKILLRTEQEVLVAGGTVARFAGIYGPGRSVLMKKFLEGKAILEQKGHRWINQIHRDDGAQALAYLLKTPAGIYNVCDDQPATQYEIYQWLGDFFQRPLPPESSPNFERKRGWTSKRVSNQKLRSYSWMPQWRSYRDAIISLAQTVK